MKSNILIVIGLFLLCSPLFGGELPSPPPLKDEPVNEQNYLSLIHRHHNNLVIVTTNPNGAILGNRGDEIIYNNSGSYKDCYNVSTGPGAGTTWRCAANALTAP